MKKTVMKIIPYLFAALMPISMMGSGNGDIGQPEAVGKQMTRKVSLGTPPNLKAFAWTARDDRTVAYSAYIKFRLRTVEDVYSGALAYYGTASRNIPSGGAPSPSFTSTSVTFPSLRLDNQRTVTIINEDGSYQQTYESLTTLMTKEAVKNNQSATSPMYYPGFQTVELVEAYTLDAKGNKYPVHPDEIFITTSPADPQAPGFITSLVKNVAFPHLDVNCKIYAKWKCTQLTKPLYPFADVMTPAYDSPTLESEYVLNIPKNMYMKWVTSSNNEKNEIKGGFLVTDEVQGDRRIIKAKLGPQVTRVREPYMTSASDLLPFFQVSAARSWEEIGNITWNALQPSQEITPEIKEFAQKIVGNKSGQEAAKLLYNWVAKNIYYLATATDPEQGYVPTPASVMLYLRYGDCKDHTSLLQTLLKAINIESYPVLVNWNNSVKQYPLPCPWFDHEMLYIPAYELYCNPTNFTNPYGVALEDTNYYAASLQTLQNKPVMICQEQDSQYVLLPTAKAEENIYQSVIEMSLDTEGNVQAKGVLKATGTPAQYVRGYGLSYANYSNLDQWLTSILSFNGINGAVTASSGPSPEDINVPLEYQYEWAAPGAIAVNADKIQFTTTPSVDFFTPAFFSQFIVGNSRQTPLLIGSTEMSWTYQIQLPDSYTIENVPEDKILETNAGVYQSVYQLTNNQLTVQREIVIKKAVYEPYEYPALLNILTMAWQDGQMPIVLNARIEKTSTPRDEPAAAKPNQI